jgi:hypothetical protein
VRLARRVANFSHDHAAGHGSLVGRGSSRSTKFHVSYGGLVHLQPIPERAIQFQFGTVVAARPSGEYAIVFDSATRAGAGGFTFRYWVNDVAPPTARLLDRRVTFGERIRVRVADSGSGVDPTSLFASLDGAPALLTYRDGVVRIATTGPAITFGKHRLRLTMHDYQENKNTENVTRILPNSRILTATVTILRPPR